MKIVTMIARLLLGLTFFVLGLNTFLHFIPTPPMSGPAGDFLNVINVSHFAMMTSGFQVIAGALLLANQYVHLSLVVLGAIIVNILTYHILMMPAGLPIALFVTILWVIVALQHRDLFAVIFTRRPDAVSPS